MIRMIEFYLKGCLVMSKIITQEISVEEAKKLGIDEWSEWTCQPSTFDWEYSEDETAYVFEGDVMVRTDDEEVHIIGGMLVTFPKGMQCVWEVRKPVRKVYTLNFRK